MFAPLVDAITGRVSAWKARFSAAYVTLVNPDTGVPYDSANPIPVDATVVMPTGLATSALQTAGNTSLSNLDTDVGAQADAAATTDTGSFSIIAFIKRGLQNWTTLLARVPTLVSGRTPVDGSGVTQPVSAASLPLPAGAATETTLAAVNGKLPSPVSGRVPVDASGLTLTVIPINPNGGSFITTASEETLTALNNKVPAQSTPGLLPVDTLGTPGVPRVQATGAAAASIALTTTCRRLSMYATQGTWYSISGTATSSSHYIAAGERLDIDVPASTTISVLQETSAGSIRISELT